MGWEMSFLCVSDVDRKGRSRANGVVTEIHCPGLVLRGQAVKAYDTSPSNFAPATTAMTVTVIT